jgi:hypothetical protein
MKVTKVMNDPTLEGGMKTDKGEHKIFKPRIAKLMPAKPQRHARQRNTSSPS